MWESSRKALYPFIVIKAVEETKTTKDLLLKSILEEAKQIFEISQDRKQMSWEAFQGNKI